MVLIWEERRIGKWRKIIGVGGSDWKHYVRRKPHVVQRRIRKGIPDCLRGLVWQLISRSRDLLLMNPLVCMSCSNLLCMRLQLQSWILFVIFLAHSPHMFSSHKDMVLAGLPLLQQYLFQFEQLVREHLPKLGEHFIQEMINPSMYASQWFIAVFLYSFPFSLALQTWDVFLYGVSNPVLLNMQYPNVHL